MQEERPNLTQVIAGKMVMTPTDEDHVVVADHVPDEELTQIYSESQVQEERPDLTQVIAGKTAMTPTDEDHVVDLTVDTVGKSPTRRSPPRTRSSTQQEIAGTCSRL